MKPSVAALIAAGGAVGAGARYLVFERWPVTPGTFPATTLAINVLGAFALGIVVTRGARVWWTRPLLGIGILSGFTTMSTLAVETASLARRDDWGLLLAYVVASIAVGTAAAWSGLRVGRR